MKIKWLCIGFFLFLALPVLSSAETEPANTSVEATSSSNESIPNELLLFSAPYGLMSSRLETHVYLSIQYWNYENQALGKYADQGSTDVGRSNIIPYSGYIDMSSKINKHLKVEAEFELYKGGGSGAAGTASGLKICKLRGLWQPWDYVGVSMGRDFGLIGMQEKTYYPTSKYKLFTIPPFLHLNVVRYTGWWDSGLFLYSQIPMTLFSPKGKIFLDASVTNGPGIMPVTTVTPDSNGYMYEYFHDVARQSTDNNNEKPITTRLSVSPWEGCELGGSYLETRWDEASKYTSQYIFSHFLLDWNDLTLVAEYGQLKFSTPAFSYVTQFSGYVAVGYTVLKNMENIKLLQPVFRYEHFDSWKEDPTRKGYRESISAGLRYSPFDGWVIKAAYQITRELFGPSLANNGFASEVVFEF